MWEENEYILSFQLTMNVFVGTLSFSWISVLDGRPRFLFPSGTTDDDPEVDATALLAVDEPLQGDTSPGEPGEHGLG